jgi:hypothetical protein
MCSEDDETVDRHCRFFSYFYAILAVLATIFGGIHQHYLSPTCEEAFTAAMQNAPYAYHDDTVAFYCFSPDDADQLRFSCKADDMNLMHALRKIHNNKYTRHFLTRTGCYVDFNDGESNQLLL